MTSHRIRASAALLSALVVAALFQLVQANIVWPDLVEGTVLDQLWRTAKQTATIGLPIGIAAVVVTELLRLRQLNVQIALGTALTFFGAHLATRGEPLSSYVYSGGPLATLGLIATGVAASLTYWAIAGRHAGWRGEAFEKADALATEVYRRVSAPARAERCDRCLAAWAAISTVVFALFAWGAIDGTGLRSQLQATAEREAQAALAGSGYTWAAFKIFDSRGAIQGSAPDEFEKRIAYETTRETLSAVTGFPGIISRIEDKAAALNAMALANQKLAEAKRREQEANQAIEQARLVAEAARTAEAEAKRKAAEALANTFNSPQTEPSQPEHDIAALNAEAPSANQVGANPTSPSTDTHACTEQDLALVESSRVVFAPQTFEIAADYQRALDRIAASVRSCSSHAVMITGYADANADMLFNQALGLQRAGAVRDGLIARGVNATHVAIKAPPVGFFGYTGAADRDTFRKAEIKLVEGVELSRDATQRPDERATNCESDLSEIMAQSIIHFSVASARISEESMGLISKLAGAIQNCGSVIVTVEGHTDKIGTPERNQQLSVMRANAVRDALVNVGADPTRLASRGFASTRPFALEESAEAYALNRRIEFKVSGKFTSTKAGGP